MYVTHFNLCGYLHHDYFTDLKYSPKTSKPTVNEESTNDTEVTLSILSDPPQNPHRMAAVSIPNDATHRRKQDGYRSALESRTWVSF